MCCQTIDNSRYTSWNHCTREVYTISHGIAGTYFNRNLIFLLQLHQFYTERDNESVNIRTGNIFQMTSWADTCLKTFPNDTQIQIHNLASCHFHLIENMIIGAADKNSCLTKTDFFYKFKILLAGTNPCSYFWEFISSLQTFVHCITVLLTI